MARIERNGDVFVLDLGDGENRFNAESLDEIEACLDEVEAAAPCALVTSARGKFWSNGLDLEWLAGQGDAAVPGSSAASSGCWPGCWSWACRPWRRSRATPSRRGRCWRWHTTSG